MEHASRPRLNIRIQLAAAIAVALSAMLLIAVVSALGEKNALLEDKKETTRHLVNSAHSILTHFHHMQQAGILPESEAKQAALDTLRRMQFEDVPQDNEYFWITDMRPRMVMHPTMHQLDGMDLTEYRDAKGKRLFIESIERVTRDGSGYVEYWWPKPGLSDSQPKLSYVKGFAPWGWVVGSGFYVNDLDKLFLQRLLTQTGIIAGVLGVLGTLLVWVVRQVERKIDHYAAALQHSNTELHHFAQVAAEAQRLARLGNWDWNLAEDRIDWSDEMFRIFRVSPDTFAVSYETFLALVHPDDRERVVRAVSEVVVAKTPFEMDCRALLPDGAIRYVYLRATPECDESGELARLFGTLQDITSIKESEAALDRLAHHDPLTGLPNRLLLNARAEHSLTQARRKGKMMAILFIDLDRFKYINDTLGHPTGDLLLQEVAARIKRCVREGDTVARIGGDEFTVVIEELENAAQAGAVAQKLLAALPENMSLHGHEVFVTCSIGISLFPGDGDNVAVLFKNADSAMYRAKEQGRDNYQFYTEELTRLAVERLTLENELRHALDRSELRLHYQPQVDLQHGTITGMEALVRWEHPERGLLPPATFIPIAEETGLIVPLGKWVLRTACAQNKSWLDAGISTVPVAVNLSPHQFRQKNLVETVADVLRDTGLAPEYLELEITESLAMFDVEASIVVLRRLKELGVRFSIDDFGTGYSSLSYLKRFPIDKIKIDKSFVRDITTDPDDAAISQAIISLSHSLKLKVIAEGVERPEQREFLSLRDCDEFQGYHYSRPVPPADMERMLRTPQQVSWDRDQTTAESGATVLLVDDEPNVLNALVRLLRSDGYRLLLAHQCEQAFDLLASNDVSVIVADYGMPGMNGVEFLRRASLLYPATVRIMLTAHPDWKTAAEAINEGAVYKFVAKPWNDFQLREHLREAVRIARRSGRNHSPAGADIHVAAGTSQQSD